MIDLGLLQMKAKLRLSLEDKERHEHPNPRLFDMCCEMVQLVKVNITLDAKNADQLRNDIAIFPEMVFTYACVLAYTHPEYLAELMRREAGGDEVPFAGVAPFIDAWVRAHPLTQEVRNAQDESSPEAGEAGEESPAPGRSRSVPVEE